MVSTTFFLLMWFIVIYSIRPVRFWNWNWYSVVPTEFLTVTFPVCSSSEDNSSGMINLVVYTFPSCNEYVHTFSNLNLKSELRNFIYLCEIAPSVSSSIDTCDIDCRIVGHFYTIDDLVINFERFAIQVMHVPKDFLRFWIGMELDCNS